MGLYLRKSKSFGPLRLNFSKSGVGMSVGVKGFRVGTRAGGGKYVSAGRNGVYYRKSLSASPRRSASRPTPPRREAPRTTATGPSAAESLLARHQAEAIAAGIATNAPSTREADHPPAPSTARDERIEDLERQVEDLQHQLADAQRVDQLPDGADPESPEPGEEPQPRPTAPAEPTVSASTHEAHMIHLSSDDPVAKAVSRHGPRFMSAKLAVIGLLLFLDLLGLHSKHQSVGGYVGSVVVWGAIAGFVIWHQRRFDAKYPIVLDYDLEPGPATSAWSDLCSSLRPLEAPGSVFATLAEGDRWTGTTVESPGSLGSLKQLGVHVSHVATIDRVKVAFDAPSLTMSDRVLYFLPDRVLFSIGLVLRPRWAAISIPYADLGVVTQPVTVAVAGAVLPGSTIESNSRAQEVVTYGEISFVMKRHHDHEIARIHTPTAADADAIAEALRALAASSPPPPKVSA